jgi:hypothetical protein
MTTTTAPRMTEDHVRALLALLVSLDGRLRASDENSAALRTRAWSTLLAEVDPGFAVKYAEHAYQELRELAITPAEILGAWREHERLGAETAGEALFDASRYVGQQHGWDPVMVDYLRDVNAAVRAGQDPASVPLPETARKPLTAEQDAWQRRCPYHRLCACDHTACRDGFLDEEEIRVGWNGLPYPTVTRCLHCLDALKMAIETGVAKDPAARNAGRRGR